MGEPGGSSALWDGVRLAVGTLTVLPVRTPRIDARAATVAMSVAPLVGAALGAVVAGVSAVLLRYGLSPLPVAALIVVLLAVLTRGLHLDGLADTVDGLASYRPAAEALQIMKSSEIGALGVVAVGAVFVIDTSALSVLAQRRDWLAIILAIAAGRSMIAWYCRRSVPAARPEGLGAAVASSVPSAVPALWTLILLSLSWPATHRHWTGLVAISLATALSLVLLAHVRRRLGGVTGDVLGAGCELGTAVALVLFSVR